MVKSNKSNYRQKISKLVYIPAILSIIPVIGIPFGISALLWGISDWKIGGKKAVTIVMIGFLSTLLFGSFIYSVVNDMFKSPAMVETKASYTKDILGSLIRYIEYYRLGHGQYPNSLDELEEKDISINKLRLIDVFTTRSIIPIYQGGQQFSYELQEDGNSYSLFSVGPDKIPNTPDDIYPVVLDEYKHHIGLRTSSVQSP